MKNFWAWFTGQKRLSERTEMTIISACTLGMTALMVYSYVQLPLATTLNDMFGWAIMGSVAATCGIACLIGTLLQWRSMRKHKS